MGYKSNNGNLLKCLSPPQDLRGRHKKHAKNINIDLVISHIKSFAPSISHYRREHAPKKMYLPRDLTIELMHKQFLELYGPKSCSYEFYRQTISKRLNISLTKLGNEECEKCLVFKFHKETHTPDLSETCNRCLSYKNHIKNASEAREEYKKCQSIIEDSEDTLTVDADLQKIIMLPRMDMYKEVIFTPRLIAFNESFVPIKKFTKQRPPFAAVWHEAVSGRKKADIVSTYHAFFTSYARDFKNIIIWVDNCTAQIKNWCLFGFLIYIVNSNEIASNLVTIKYFETGHTFMAADAFHSLVEKQLRRNEKVYDFQDFCNIILKCTKVATPLVKIMEYKDFKIWPTLSSKYQTKKLNNGLNISLRDIKEV